jgi:hypothetical protein
LVRVAGDEIGVQFLDKDTAKKKPLKRQPAAQTVWTVHALSLHLGRQIRAQEWHRVSQSRRDRQSWAAFDNDGEGMEMVIPWMKNRRMSSWLFSQGALGALWTMKKAAPSSE